MRTLLLGGNGFMGRFVAPLLQQQGHAVAVFHRGSTPAPEGVEEILGERGQLGECADALRRFAAEVVIDFVLSSGSQAQELMQVFRGAARRVVMISSIDVYRATGVLHGTEHGPLQEVPLTEDSELRRTLVPYPPEAVARMRQIFPWLTDDYDKIPAERVVMSEPEMPGTVLRLPMVYGPGDPLHRFYPVVKRIADGRRHILLSAPLAAWRTTRGYVENVAAAIALAAGEERAAGRIYNVCEEPAYSELEWARKIAAAMHWDGEFIVLPPESTPSHLLTPGNLAQHWEASSARLRQELGYREPVAMDEAIRRTIQWELENPPHLEVTPPFDYAAEDVAADNRPAARTDQ